MAFDAVNLYVGIQARDREPGAVRGPDGWTAELAIPWRSRRYPRGESRFGFDVFRLLRRRHEESALGGWRRARGGLHRVSAFATLIGLEGLPRRPLNLEAITFAALEGERAAAGRGRAVLPVHSHGLHAASNPAAPVVVSGYLLGRRAHGGRFDEVGLVLQHRTLDRRFSGQARLVFTHHPASDLVLVLSEDRGDPETARHALALKVSLVGRL